MARSINRLSPRTVASVASRGYYADGGGLYLQVSAYGTKSWLFRFTLAGKAREMGLGAVHTVSLADARQEAERCRKLIRDGVDPIEVRKSNKQAALAAAAKNKPFRECAEDYIRSHEVGWSNAKHAAQWTSTLEAYVYPIMGGLSVAAIDTGLVMKVLEPIWATKTETAGRVLGRIESILDWAKTRGFRQGENPARLKGHLENLLPNRSKVRAVKHLAALPFDEVGAFMTALRATDGISARGLEFQILTATRPGETYGASWSEVDLDKRIWTTST